MSTERDDELGAALRQLPVPDHQPSFWEDLDRRMSGEQGVDELAARRERRFRGPKLWIPSVAAAVVLAVAAVALLDDAPDTRVQVTTPSTTSTTPAVTPSTTAPVTTSSTPVTPTSAPVTRPGTEEFPGIYPVTSFDELGRYRQQIESGEQLTPLDRDGLVRQYLADHQVSNPRLEGFDGAGGAAVLYSADKASGTVRLGRLGMGSDYVITSATTELVQSVTLRRTGGRLDVTVAPAVAGAIRARVGPFRSEFDAEATGQGTPGSPVELRLDLPHATEPALLRVELDAGALGRGFAEVRVAAEPSAPVGPPVTADATLDATRLGPLTIGMTFEEAHMATDRLTQKLDPYCDALEPDGLTGVAFVRRNTDRAITLIFVSTEAIRTSKGVGVGSTLAEVIRAHGEPNRRGGDESLVYDAGSGSSGPGLRFVPVDGRVVSVIAGLGVSADEHCA